MFFLVSLFVSVWVSVFVRFSELGGVGVVFVVAGVAVAAGALLTFLGWPGGGVAWKLEF